ncbi:MAG: AraC family transcriptional regulator [Rhodocyclaceae bacterium]|nr:AraC family transcriptional regulator [Rhodocyclaceae bacterium]MBX3670343.1 AraC family transcriptional regulator [Rhodocyclaceae bacterium]
MRYALPPIPDPARGIAATPVAFIRAIVAAYRRYGADPADALARARIAPALLHDAQGRVTAAQMELMSAHAMQELDDEALGWFSRRLPWGSYGMLCRASITAPDLGVALKRWCRHHRLLTGDLLYGLDCDGSLATLALEERCELGELREFCLLTSLRYVLGYASWAVDSAIPLAQVNFPFPAPPHARVYELLFPGPVRFGAPQAAFSFDCAYLDLPLCRDEAALRAMLQRALPLTVLRYRRDRLLAQRLRQLLRAHPEEIASAELLAARLSMSARTLHRQLLEQGTSLQALKDELRCEHALHLLRRTQKPLKQIAQAVGFRNEKSFMRAFRGWTGMTPGMARASPAAINKQIPGGEQDSGN